MGISRKLECSSSSPTCFVWKSSTQNYHLERSTKVLRTVSAYFGALWITKSGAWSQKPVKHTHVQTASKTYLRPTKMYPEHIRKRPTGTHILCHFHMRLFTFVWTHRSIWTSGMNKASSTEQLSRDQPHLLSSAKLPAGESPKSLFRVIMHSKSSCLAKNLPA